MLRSLLCFVLAAALMAPAGAYGAFSSPVVNGHEPEDAFGNVVFQSGTTANAYRYCGEQFDPDLGLYYNRARYLNTDSGRFWSMDTYEGKSSDPVSLHKYLYGNADPVAFVDRSGHFSGSLAELDVAETANETIDKAVYTGVNVSLLAAIAGVGVGAGVGVQIVNELATEKKLKELQKDFGDRDCVGYAQAAASYLKKRGRKVDQDFKFIRFRGYWERCPTGFIVANVGIYAPNSVADSNLHVGLIVKQLLTPGFVIDNNWVFPSPEAWGDGYSVYVFGEGAEGKTLNEATFLGAGNIKIGGPEILTQ